MSHIAHKSDAHPSEKGGLKPKLLNFFMKVLLLHGDHLAMGYNFLKGWYPLIQINLIYDG